MARRLLLLLLALGPGCAAIYQTGADPQVFGGTRLIARRWPSRGGTNGNPAGAMLQVLFNVGAPLDLPFSLLMDTVLLPYTAVVGLHHALSSSPPPSAEPRPRAREETDEELARAPSAARLVHRAQLRQHRGDLEGAVADCGRALALEPGHVAALVTRGRVELRRARSAEARVDLDRAIELDPRHVDARVLRGRVRLADEDPSGAIEDWSRAEALAAGTWQGDHLPGEFRRLVEGHRWADHILQELRRRRRERRGW